MVAEWRLSTLGGLCDAGMIELQTGPFGSQLHAHDYAEEGVPVVPTEAICDRQIDHFVLHKISRRKAEELARHRLLPGDILFARRGVQATGHIGYVREAKKGFICGTGAIRQGEGGAEPPMIAHIELHREELRELCRRFGVRRLDVFGSAARGDFDPARSDIDFLVEFDAGAPDGLSLKAFFAFKDAVEALFGRGVDLVEAGALRNPYVKATIERSRETVFAA